MAFIPLQRHIPLHQQVRVLCAVALYFHLPAPTSVSKGVNDPLFDQHPDSVWMRFQCCAT